MLQRKSKQGHNRTAAPIGKPFKERLGRMRKADTFARPPPRKLILPKSAAIPCYKLPCTTCSAMCTDLHKCLAKWQLAILFGDVFRNELTVTDAAVDDSVVCLHQTALQLSIISKNLLVLSQYKNAINDIIQSLSQTVRQTEIAKKRNRSLWSVSLQKGN